jgi:hypothetical protein
MTAVSATRIWAKGEPRSRSMTAAARFSYDRALSADLGK